MNGTIDSVKVANAIAHLEVAREIEAHGSVKAYWRCPTCLTVYCTVVPKPVEPTGHWRAYRAASDLAHLRPYTPTCAHCDTAVEAMGIVTATGGVALTTTDTVCDWSCQSALGPTCDCKCGGANHGDTLARKIVILEHRAKAPVVTVDDPAAAKARAEEYRAAVATATAALKARYVGVDAIMAKKAAGTWLDNREFSILLNYRRAYKILDEAKSMKTHKARMKKLTALAAD